MINWSLTHRWKGLEFRAVRRPCAVLLALLLTLAMPAVAGACSRLTESSPATWRYGVRPPLAVGDSTMILAAPLLADHGLHANAKGCRSFKLGLAYIRERRRVRKLPSVVVMALGANWSITHRQMRRALFIIGPRRTLVLVTSWELNNRPSPDAERVRTFASSHATRVVLLDWVRYSSRHRNWLNDDHLHPTELGARKYAAFLGKAVTYAKPAPVTPPPAPAPAPAPTPPPPTPPAPAPTPLPAVG